VAPFKDPMTVSVPSLVKVPVVTVNVPQLAPPATVTDEGVLNAPAAVIAIDTPPVPATLFKPAVHVAVIPGPITAGAHCNDVINTGPTSDRLAFLVVPLIDAVTVALPSAETTVAPMLKDTVVEPAGTLTIAGTLTVAVSDDIGTATPPAGAA